MIQQSPDWTSLPLQEHWTGNALQSLIEGYKAGRMPAQMRQEEEQRKLANRLMQTKINAAEEAGGLDSLTGIAGQVASLEMLRKKVGEDSPIYQRALKAFELQQAHTQETMDSSQFYRENPWRLYDPFTKQIHAQQNAAQGNYPEGGKAYSSPEQAQQAVNLYESHRYNKNVPIYLQQQKEASDQIDETLKLIDSKKAFSYSGIKGKADLFKDRYDAQRNGKITQRLKDFEEQETYLHNFREQIRSYLGASITAGMTRDLDYLVNPDNWMNHPEIAERKFEAVVRAYENEKKITDKAIKHGNPSAPNPIFGAKQNNPAQKFEGAANQLGLNPPAETFTKENVLKTAEEKNWSPEKTQFILKKMGLS